MKKSVTVSILIFLMTQLTFSSLPIQAEKIYTYQRVKSVSAIFKATPLDAKHSQPIDVGVHFYMKDSPLANFKEADIQKINQYLSKAFIPSENDLSQQILLGPHAVYILYNKNKEPVFILSKFSSHSEITRLTEVSKGIYQEDTDQSTHMWIKGKTPVNFNMKFRK